jgi:hypothetical protein
MYAGNAAALGASTWRGFVERTWTYDRNCGTQESRMWKVGWRLMRWILSVEGKHYELWEYPGAYG